MDKLQLVKAIVGSSDCCNVGSSDCCNGSAIRGKHIVVGQRGFVWMGNVREDGEYIVIDDCSCIRVWGTTKGLGEIALSGPTPKTVLDPQPVTRLHRLAVVEMIQCK